MSRRNLVGAAVGIGVVALVLMLVIGFRPLSGFDDLAPGSYDGLVAYTDGSRGGNQQACVYVFDLTTATEAMEPFCDEWIFVFGFDARGLLVDTGSGSVLVPLDGGSPTPVERDFKEPDRMPPFVEDESSGALIIDGQTVLELSGPSDYRIEQFAVLDDQVLVKDSADRLIVAKTDGSAEPMLIATGVSESRWQVLG